MPPEPVPIQSSFRHAIAIIVVIGIVGSIALAALNEMLDVATANRDGAAALSLPDHVPRKTPVVANTTSNGETDALPISWVAALGNRRPTIQEAHIETIELAQADELLTEDLRLRTDYDDDLLLLWFDDCFRHSDDMGDCVEMTFIDGGGRLDESLTYCFERQPVVILTSNEVAALDTVP